MKLMLFGSLLVVLGIVALAAMEWAIDSVREGANRPLPVQPVFRSVNAAEPKAIVWQTSTAANDCAEMMARRKRNEKQRIADLVRSAADFSLVREDENPCAPFQLGEVEPGTKVEVLDEYGRMARIRILAGSLQGRQGHIERERLSEAVD